MADATLLPQVVATELAIRKRPGRELLDTLIDDLDEKRILIVLDNCEHLVEACAGLVERLLRSCPRLVVMATSREPLGVPGEWLGELARGRGNYDEAGRLLTDALALAHDVGRPFWWPAPCAFSAG